jgi:FtsZ-binding cell division protein ZapB
MAERTESVVLDFEVDVDDSIESIQSLTKANKELREERNKLNIASDAGKKRAQEINTQLDQNTNKIKANVSALEKQKINIGNYKSALDGVHPALGKVGQGLEAGASGFKAMAKSALAFIATPIGAILAALVAVFSLLKNALSQNDALMDKFENVTNAVGVVLEVVRARLAKFAEAVIAFITLDFDKGIELTAQALLNY